MSDTGAGRLGCLNSAGRWRVLRLPLSRPHVQIKKSLLVTHLQNMRAMPEQCPRPRSELECQRSHYRTERIPVTRLRSIRTKLLLTLMTKHLKMTLVVCGRGWESTAVQFPITLRLPNVSWPSLLSAPSAASQPDFSSAGYDSQERRSQLKPSTVLFCTAI